jgi:hypothetical protein
MAISRQARILITLVTLAGLLGVTGPEAAAAAARRISTSTYQSTIKCADGPEPWCQTNSANLPYTLLKVSGKGFSANGLAYVTVINMTTWTTVTAVTVQVDGSGNFVFKRTGVEVCATGTPLLIQAYDFVGQVNSNVATVMECSDY